MEGYGRQGDRRPHVRAWSGVDERVRTGLRVEKLQTLPLGPIRGGNLKPGLYKMELLMVQPSAAGEGVVEVELGGSRAIKDTVDVSARAGGKDKVLSFAYTVEIAGAALELTLRPVRGAVYASGVSLAPAAGLQ